MAKLKDGFKGLYVILPDIEYDQLQAQAEKERETKKAIIRRALKEYLKKQRRPR